MDVTEGGDAVRLSERGVGRAASEFLAGQSDRRKRGRVAAQANGGAPWTGNAVFVDPRNEIMHGEPDPKRRALGAPSPGTINVTAAKKAASVLLNESPTYRRLIEVEERIDLAIMRKQQDIKDALNTGNPSMLRTFRLYILNTYRSPPKKTAPLSAVPVSPTVAAAQAATTAVTAVPASIPTDGAAETAADAAGAKSEASNASAENSDDVLSWSLRIQGEMLPLKEVRPTPDAAGAGPASTPAGAGVDGAQASAVQGDAAPGDQPRPSTSGTGAPSGSQPGGPTDGSSKVDAKPSSSADPSRATNTPTTPAAPVAASANPSTSPPSQPSASISTDVRAPSEPETVYHCTDVLKKVVVCLNKEEYPDNHLIEWVRAENDPASNGFEISRQGNKDTKAEIYLYVDHKPERFKLSPQLSKLLGIKHDTRTGTFSAVWQYIKKANLQCVDDRTSVRLDDGLRTLFTPDHATIHSLKLQRLFEAIKMHLGPADPIRLDYTIKVSGNVVDNQSCFDIQVHVPDTSVQNSAEAAGVFGLAFPNSAEFAALNEKHLEALERVAYHKRRREFFEGFCEDPVNFINKLILSQTRDLQALAPPNGRNPEDERRSSFYQQQWVHEAIPRYLLRKAILDASKANTAGVQH